MATRNGLRARDGHERISEKILESAKAALEEHLPAIEKSLFETGGEQPASITITAAWKSDPKEGLLLTVKARTSISAGITTFKASISGGQLTLFDGAPAE